MTVTEDRPAEGGPVKEIGRDRRRKEDQRLITGRTRWTDNIQLTGMLHLAMVRSPYAHARITNVDTTEAKAAPNVSAVLTGQDVKDEQGGIPTAWNITTEQVNPVHPAIAVDRVAFAGEVVAVVVARSAAEARDAAELVDVDYEELPASRSPPRTRCWRTRTWVRTSPRSGSSTRPTPAPADRSTRPSRRPAPTGS
jgi:aerobic carbon-monoxide dehydrogenase large subunit